MFNDGQTLQPTERKAEDRIQSMFSTTRNNTVAFSHPYSW